MKDLQTKELKNGAWRCICAAAALRSLSAVADGLSGGAGRLAMLAVFGASPCCQAC